MKKPRHSEYQQVFKIIGARIKAARELCGFSQQKASSLLGYANSSKLAKVEGNSIDAVPLWLIPKAANVYGVSIDFLFGVSECWQRDPTAAQEQQIIKWLEKHYQQIQTAQSSAIQALYDKHVELERSVNRFLDRAKENLECVTRVQELNPEFEDLRGGAKLLRVIAETAEEAMGLGFELEKLRTVSEAERLIDEILQNPRHPVIDRKNPDHEHSKRAFDELKSNIDESRARIGVERVLAFEKVSKNIK